MGGQHSNVSNPSPHHQPPTSSWYSESNEVQSAVQEVQVAEMMWIFMEQNIKQTWQNNQEMNEHTEIALRYF